MQDTLGLVSFVLIILIFVQFGRLEGRLKHIQDSLARIEKGKGKK